MLKIGDRSRHVKRQIGVYSCTMLAPAIQVSTKIPYPVVVGAGALPVAAGAVLSFFHAKTPSIQLTNQKIALRKAKS